MVALLELQRTLITANHILHYQNNLDAFGHISARHPEDPTTYLLSANIAPALVSNASNLVQYRVNDSEALDPNAPRGYIERYIHGELYKRFPEVNSVIHSHNADVLTYAVSGVPLRPVYHMAGFLGDDVPVWDIFNYYNNTSIQDLLVRTPDLGKALAITFSSPENQTDGGDLSTPDHSVVLMRRHGYTIWGTDIKQAVFRALFTQWNAQVQTSAIGLRNAFGNLPTTVQSVWAAEGDNLADLEPLTGQAARDTASSIEGQSDRPWRLWVQEVENNSLYQNNV